MNFYRTRILIRQTLPYGMGIQIRRICAMISRNITQ